MKRWFMDLPVMRKLLLGFGLLSPLVLGMIVIDISLSIQQAVIAKRVAHAFSLHSVASEVVAMSTISHQLLLWNFLLGGLAIVLGCGCSILMSRVITRPLRQAQEVARLASNVWLMELADGLVALAQGDWSVSVKQRSLPIFYRSQDEIGQITQSVQKIMTTIYNMSAIYETTRQELQTLYTCIQKQNETLSIANAHLSSLATTDPLTGLPNHRDIMDRIDREIKQCQTTQRNCAIIFVDVDRFKCINDTWGHGAGDEVLHFVGQQLRACVRLEDYVGRYGGEEFAILLTDIEQHEAFELAERLRDSIAIQPYMWQMDANRAVAIPVTASFGLAVYPLDGVTRKDLIDRADAAMYIAKHSGRNRVCLPDEEVVNEEALHDPHPTRPLQTLTLV
jgi:diguanylate cyclase (GGDEF)-like protein